MSILGVITGQQFAVVPLGTLEARVRRVTSRDLLDHGYPLILAARVARAQTGEDEQLTASGKAMGRLLDYREALAVAGLVALREPEGEWETWTATGKSTEEDHKARVIWLGSLPYDLGNPTDILSEGVLRHSGEGKAAEALATFRGAGSVPDRQAGSEVREVADGSAVADAG